MNSMNICQQLPTFSKLSMHSFQPKTIPHPFQPLPKSCTLETAPSYLPNAETQQGFKGRIYIFNIPSRRDTKRKISSCAQLSTRVSSSAVQHNSTLMMQNKAARGNGKFGFLQTYSYESLPHYRALSIPCHQRSPS